MQNQRIYIAGKTDGNNPLSRRYACSFFTGFCLPYVIEMCITGVQRSKKTADFCAGAVMFDNGRRADI